LAGLGLSYGHGDALTNVENLEVAKKALMPMRIAFMGELAFLGASLIFFGSMVCLLFRNCCGECSPMSLIRQCCPTKAEGGAE
jgi:endonuclease III